MNVNSSKMSTILEPISAVFISHAAGILADTTKGLTGSAIIQATTGYAIDYGVSLPHSSYPFGTTNKRTALYENIMAFPAKAQYRILRELCDHATFSPTPSPEIKKLKIQLATNYSHLSTDHSSSEVNESLVEETRHWLKSYPLSLQLYNEALSKLEAGVFHRNLLDDLRLSFEKLLQDVFVNEKSLENQVQSLGGYIKVRGGSLELSNMFFRLTEYYAKYQNTYIKHDDAVIEPEIEFVFEITSSFMKHLIRLTHGNHN